MEMAPIAEVALDLSTSNDKMWARLYAPQREDPSGDWSCTFEIEAPISIRRTIYGVSSLQAIVLALKTMAAYLYGSDAYQNKEIGLDGDFGGNLSLPAPSAFLDIAPYPF
jgi:hypothetical protein